MNKNPTIPTIIKLILELNPNLDLAYDNQTDYYLTYRRVYFALINITENTFTTIKTPILTHTLDNPTLLPFIKKLLTQYAKTHPTH